ncbi:hypothetical protein AWU65_14645 [Paenibacillus glucanolyticus]|uniref:Uncharacterized protein n=1 Tax=Paenibacillus glucanolyticus TaxID=59843 RepID=A0A163K9K6_9BACL|nr:hypothetical protein [Paenibacillus glucanolyticus]KZS47076.1 hypothetical protein AWU65_14645 [Paenibacillus glucanolyticus]
MCAEDGLLPLLTQEATTNQMMILKVERSFDGKESFICLLFPLIDAEIDRIMQQQDGLMYNDGNANTSHSEEAA